jgi:fibronectin type 3 domain-containing protein
VRRLRGLFLAALAGALVLVASGCVAVAPGFLACLASGVLTEEACVADAFAPGPPNAPTGLTAVVVDTGEPVPDVLLDWRDSAEPDLREYRVYASRSSGGPYTLVAILKKPTLTAAPSTYTETCALTSVCALVTCTRSYVVTAVDAISNESEYSEEASVRLDCTPPPAPTGVTAEGGDGEVVLRWDQGPDAVRWSVERSGAAGGPFARIASPEDAPRYRDPDVENGTTYFYRVTAFDEAGNQSEPSAIASGTPSGPGIDFPPTPPTGLTATAGDGLVRLDWNDSPAPDRAGYHVYAAAEADGAYARITAELATVSELVDGGLPNGVPRHYRVTAVDLAGNESDPSATVSATPTAGGTGPGGPSPPTGLTATPGDHEVALDWADNPEPSVTGYDVQLATSATGPFSTNLRRPVTVSQHTVVDLPIQPFFFRVVAIDAAGNRSAPSAVVSATPCPAACLTSRRSTATPFTLTVTGGFDRGGTSRLDGEAIVGTGFGFAGTFVLRVKANEAKHGTWRALVDWRLAPAARSATSTGIALATFDDPALGAVCLRFDEASTVKRRGTERRIVTRGVFRVLGASGQGAQLLGGGSYGVEARPDGSLVYDGKAIRAATAAPPPPECLALASS